MCDTPRATSDSTGLHRIDLGHDAQRQPARGASGDVEALLKQRQLRIPLPFMGDGRDTVAEALFLASDEARFVTGTEIVVDGGMSVRRD